MDDENNPIMIIYDSDGREININDIFQIDEKEFRIKYKTKASMKAYTSYRNAYTIKEGRELMETILQEVEKEKNRYKGNSPNISILDL